MRQKKDAFDLAVDEAFRDSDRMKRQAKDAELVARMDQHASRARAKMYDLARTANPFYDLSGLFRHAFSKQRVLEMAECLPHEWQDLVDAFDRMADLGLGNDGRDWFLGPPSIKATRRSHMLKVGDGVIRRAGKQAEIDDEAGHTRAVIGNMTPRDRDMHGRLPATLDALGHPMPTEVAQRLIGPTKETMKTCDKNSSHTWLADLPYCPYCNIAPEARVTWVKEHPDA